MVNVSHLYVFPTERAFIKYIYTPKMDVYQLVYDLGGIIGLWFGLSAYSIILKSSLALGRQINGKCGKITMNWMLKLISHLVPNRMNLHQSKRIATKRKRLVCRRTLR